MRILIGTAQPNLKQVIYSATPIGNHTFRATGMAACLANGGALKRAQEMAVDESPRATKPYDRTRERLTQDEVERIRL
jgi:hypothetical protein